MFLLQNNWFNVQDYYEKDQVNYVLGAYAPGLYKTTFSYEALQSSSTASLSFHLTAAEKKGIASSLDNEANQRTFSVIDSLSGSGR
jgi:hypothetical protein